ncbi:methyltransferase regulatory domain-containing protein [Emcibacter sp. SYSU 3D8]|uniref:methyltransferase regulatory domain-containing protein n=1 Tax=Emcibacter sp. SYSU 3D8 TaxID=3133969 RepID=UPI0031FF3DB1
MSDWAEGYLVEIGYTYGYYSELNPLRARLPLLKTGYAPPAIGAACELGFGHGISANMHAAAGTAEWHGTDFNPSHAAFAQDMAAAGTGAKLYDEAFADFCNRSDLPDFDFIGLHGIWSWISESNMQHIVDFLRRKLKVGGICYISYNTYPGWNTVAPIRHLLTQHAATMSAAGLGVQSRVDAALDFADSLMNTNTLYGKANPNAAARLKGIRSNDRSYLAHEYLNECWVPMYFSEISKMLSSAKLNFACTATYREHIDALNLTDEQQTMLRNIPDATFRETARDFMVNQQFRRDYWVRGGRGLSSMQQLDMLRDERLVLNVPREGIKLEASGFRGAATLNEDVYKPVLDIMADGQPKTLGEIEAALKPDGKTFNQVVQAALVLIGKGDASPAHPPETVEAVRPKTEALNNKILSMAPSGRQVNYLVSPVTGGGMHVNNIGQLVLLGRQKGLKTNEACVDFAFEQFNAQGKRMARDGVAISDPAENKAEFVREATAQLERTLPIYQALGVA